MFRTNKLLDKLGKVCYSWCMNGWDDTQGREGWVWLGEKEPLGEMPLSGAFPNGEPEDGRKSRVQLRGVVLPRSRSKCDVEMAEEGWRGPVDPDDYLDDGPGQYGGGEESMAEGEALVSGARDKRIYAGVRAGRKKWHASLACVGCIPGRYCCPGAIYRGTVCRFGENRLDFPCEGKLPSGCLFAEVCDEGCGHVR